MRTKGVNNESFAPMSPTHGKCSTTSIMARRHVGKSGLQCSMTPFLSTAQINCMHAENQVWKDAPGNSG